MDNILNLIKFAGEEKPTNFSSELETILKQKSLDSIANKKLDLARNMFNTKFDNDDNDIDDVYADDDDDETENFEPEDGEDDE